jgi:hypothetical protein
MAAFGDVNSAILLTRQVIITLDDFRKGATSPTDVTIGTTPTIPGLHFDATAELLSIFFPFPLQMDTTIDPQLILIWALSAAETDLDTLDVTLDYTAPVPGTTGSGIGKTSTQLTETVTVTTAAGLAIGDFYAMTFTFDAADATNPLANAVGIAAEFHLTNITGVAEIDLVTACFNFEATH